MSLDFEKGGGWGKGDRVGRGAADGSGSGNGSGSPDYHRGGNVDGSGSGGGVAWSCGQVKQVSEEKAAA